MTMTLNINQEHNLENEIKIYEMGRISFTSHISHISVSDKCTHKSSQLTIKYVFKQNPDNGD